MIQRIRVEKWVTSDGLHFDNKAAAERHETSTLIEGALMGALGDDVLGVSDWQAATNALLDSPHFTIIRRAKP